MLNTAYRCSSSSNTTITFTSMSIKFRPTVVGYEVILKFKCKMSTATFMYNTASTDSNIQKQWQRRLNVKIGSTTYNAGNSHEMKRTNPSTHPYPGTRVVSSGTAQFLLRSHNTPADYWYKGEEYLYELKFNATHFTNSSITVQMNVTDGAGTVRSPGDWGNGTQTISWSQATINALAPRVPNNVTLSAAEGIVTAGTKNCTLSYTAPSTTDRADVKIYWSTHQLNSGTISTTYGSTLSRTFKYDNVKDKDVIKASVCSADIYGQKSSYVNRSLTISVPAPNIIPCTIRVNSNPTPGRFAKIKTSGGDKDITNVYVRTGLGINLTNIVDNGNFANGLTDWSPFYLVTEPSNWVQVHAPTITESVAAVVIRTADNKLITGHAAAGDWMLYKFRVEVIDGMNFSSAALIVFHNILYPVVSIPGPFTNGQFVNVCVKAQLDAFMVSGSYAYRLAIGFNSKGRKPIAKITDVMAFNLTTGGAIAMSAEELNTLTPGYATSYPYPFEDKLITKTT
jgi:hypothetical protein